MRRIQKRLKRGRWYAISYETYHDGEGQQRTREKWHALNLDGAATERRVASALRAFELSRSLEKRTRTPSESATLSEAVGAFLTTHRGTVRDSTLRGYSQRLAPLLALYGGLQCASLTAHHLNALRDAMSATRSGASINHTLIVVRIACRWMVRAGYLSHDPTDDVRHLHVPRPERPFVGWSVVRLLMQHSIGCMRTAVALAGFAGLRRGEIAHMTWEDVDAEHRLIHVRSKDSHETKSGRDRVVPIHPELAPLLTGGRGLIVGRYGGMLDSLRRACVRAGMDHVVTLHDLRAGYCSEMLLLLPPATVQLIMGHASINTTLSYYSRLKSSDTLAPALDVFDRLPVP